MSNDIPDRIGIHVSKIREHLWENRAVVMVGAGFSKNADPKHGAVPPFPSWGQLIEAMIEELHPNGQNEWDMAQSIARAPAVAEQYQRVFNRGKLRDSVRDAIPDREYTPNELYKLLLSLPWQDVFTTNYDTLLERSRSTLDPEYYYDLVRSADELPYANQPRLVKLHGDLNLPNSPLIITREDYRTYPDKHAAFVNTVRQALMENILVLVGFSGDDPNFKQWFGWVRDVLKERRHQVYLCGLLNLDEGSRAVYDYEGIVPVDLAPVVPSGHQNPYKRALNWLFCSLHNGKPRSGRRWPGGVSTSPNGCSKNYAVSLIPPTTEPRRAPEWSDEDNSTIIDSLQDLIMVWKHNRELYPGWVVMPRKNRETLWHNTKAWPERVREHGDILKAPKQLRLASELAWRYQRCLRLPQNWFREWSSDLLEQFDPEGNNTWSSQEAEHRSDWFQLALLILQSHRRNWNSEAFNELVEAMQPLARFNPSWKARWHYEQCLYHLGRGYHNEVEKQIEIWDQSDMPPFWSVRKASILASLGKVERAEKIVEEALDSIRDLNRVTDNRIRNYSQEAFAMRALIAIRSASRFLNSKAPKIARSSRWDELASERCDPRRDLDYLTSKLASTNIPGKQTKQRRKVDPETGRESHSHNFSYIRLEDWQPAIELPLMLDEGGIPMRVKNVVPTFGLYKAALWMRDIASQHALSILVRSANRKRAIALFSDLIRVSPPGLSKADQLYEVFITAAHESLDGLSEEINLIIHQNKLSIFSSLLGKVAPHLSEGKRLEVLDFAIRMYKRTPRDRQELFNKDIRCLLSGTLQYIEPESLASRLSVLFGLPLNSDFGLGTDPFRYLNASKVRKALKLHCADKTETDQQGPAVRNAISLAIQALKRHEHEKSERMQALQRLLTAQQAGILQDDEKERLGNVLWLSTHGEKLPDLGVYLPWVILQLPTPKDIDSAKALKDWLLKNGLASDSRDASSLESWTPSNPNKIIQRKNVITWIESSKPVDPDEKYPRDGTKQRYICWEPEEVAPLLTELEGRLSALKRWESSPKSSVGGIAAGFIRSIENRARETWFQVPALLRRVLLPALKRGEVSPESASVDSKVEERIFDLITDLIKMQIGGRTALPSFLSYTGKRKDEVVTMVQRGFSRVDVRSILDAAEAVYRWSVLQTYHEGSSIPETLVSSLVRYVVRYGEAQAGVMRWTSNLVRHAPGVLSRTHVEDLAEACLSIFEDTSPPDMEERLQYSQENTEEEFKRRIKERKRATELGLVLYSALRNRDNDFWGHEEIIGLPANWTEDVREVLKGPLQKLQRDPYPQVRRTWKRVSEEPDIETTLH